MAKDYLRNRPFLTVTYIHRPHPDVNTSVKGWTNMTGAWQTFEQVSFVDRINNLTDYGVVIDIINSSLLRNTTTKGEDEIMATYLGKYRDDASKALAIWARAEAARIQAEGGAEAVLEAAVTAEETATTTTELDGCECHQEGIDCDHSVG